MWSTRVLVWLRITGVLVLLSMVMLLLSKELERRSGSALAERAEHVEEPGLPSFRELPALSLQDTQTTRIHMRLELHFLDPGADAGSEPCLLDLRDGLGPSGGMARRIPAHATGRLAILGPKPGDWTAVHKAMFLACIEELARRHGLCLADLVLPQGAAAELRSLLGWLRIPARRSQS